MMVFKLAHILLDIDWLLLPQFLERERVVLAVMLSATCVHVLPRRQKRTETAD